jgi:hypothetical protein
MINDEHLRKLTNKVEDCTELYQRHVLYTRLSVSTVLVSLLTIIMTVAFVSNQGLIVVVVIFGGCLAVVAGAFFISIMVAANDGGRSSNHPKDKLRAARRERDEYLMKMGDY